MASQFLIYGLTDPRNGHLRYIGQSTSGMERPKTHGQLSLLSKKNRKSSWIKSLQSKGLKYGIEVIEEYETRDLLDDAEIFWIASIRATGAELLNHQDGGNSRRGYVWTDEQKDKLKETQKTSVKVREGNIRGALTRTGRIVSLETCQKISKSYNPNSSWRGRTHTEEAKEKIGLKNAENLRTMGRSRTGIPRTEELIKKVASAKGTLPFCDELGNTYYSKRQAARILGINAMTVGRALKSGKRACGHVFTYVESK